MKLLIATVLLSFGSFTLGKSTAFTDCGSTSGKPTNVDITPCHADICVLEKGTNPNVTVTYTSNEASKTLTSKVYGVIEGVPIPFPLHNPDGCKGSGVTCPISPGNIKFSSSVEVLPSYPQLTLKIKWELKDDAGKNQFCVEVDAEIQ